MEAIRMEMFRELTFWFENITTDVYLGRKCLRELGHLGISGPTYCITSCSSVVRVLVCQLNGPGSILAVPFKSAITKGKTKLAAANHHHSIVITCLHFFMLI